MLQIQKALEFFLQKASKDNIILNKTIWECACGQGHLSEVLKQNGYNVISSDLVDRGYGISGVNFLKTMYKDKDIDILTNPPYKYAKEFVEHAMDLSNDGEHVIMFLKIQFLEGKARKKLFEKYPPKYVYVFSERQVCATNGDFENAPQSAVCYCWYVWEKGYKGEPVIRWI